VWLFVLLLGAWAFETQNTGSHDFLMTAPAVLLAAGALDRAARPAQIGAIVLAALSLAAPMLELQQRGLRAVFASLTYPAPEAASPSALFHVRIKPDVLEIARAELAPRAPETQAKPAVLSSSLVFQSHWLLSVDEAARALGAWEAASGRRLETLYALDFVSPFAVVLGRPAPRGVALTRDGERSAPPPDVADIAAVGAVDGVLIPRCNLTTTRVLLRRQFAPALAGRTMVALTPCWSLAVRP
jgi:hypothetical protein